MSSTRRSISSGAYEQAAVQHLVTPEMRVGIEAEALIASEHGRA